MKKLVFKMILWFIISILGMFCVYAVFKYEIGGFGFLLLFGGLIFAFIGGIKGWINAIKLSKFLLKNK